jgi:hypothetical protein
MKKLLLIGIILVSVFASQASYRTAVVVRNNASYNPSDTAAITLYQRVNECVRINCAKLQNGTITKAQLINNNRFTDQQLTEFSIRGSKGNLTDMLWNHFTADPSVGTDNISVSDATLDNVFLYVVWPIALLIGNGSL